MAKRHIAGMAVAVVSNGRVRYAKGYGFADIERGVRVEKNTPFLIASQTKMFTAVGTMLLVQDGKVKLDAPVGQYVDDLPAHWRRATIRQLLGHTSGINSFTTHGTPPCGRTAEESDYTQQHVIAEVACLPLDFEPGTDWSYGDTNYFVLGLLVERVSGLTYEQYLKKRILRPLGMHSTRLMGAIGVNDGRAVGYRWDGKVFVRGRSDLPSRRGVDPVRPEARLIAATSPGKSATVPKISPWFSVNDAAMRTVMRAWRTLLLLLLMFCCGVEAPAMASLAEHGVERHVVLDDHHFADATNQTQDDELGGDRDAMPHHHCSLGLSDAVHRQAIVDHLATLAPFPPLAFALPSLSASPLTEPPSA